MPTVPSPLPVRSLLNGVAIAALPVLVALLTAPVAFGGGSVLPWHPQMVDLDVYRWAGSAVLDGGDLYAESPERLPFLYPPFAAVLSVPLTLIPQAVAQIGWLVACVLALLAVVRRMGLDGWVLSLVTAAAIYFCEPVAGTLAYGQVGIFLVALVVLDLVPDPSGSRRAGRTGMLTGMATALKLTPALFVVYRWGARERRTAITTVVTAAALTIVSALLLPGPSLHYWSSLATGDSGTNSYHYAYNESVLGSWLRIVGLGGWQTATGLAMSAVVAGLGVWAAVRWHRAGDVRFAVCVCGVAGLLASPISWSHHFVWVVPLGIALLAREIPKPVKVVGWIFVGWVTAGPFKRLPAGGDVELRYEPWQLVLASVTVVLGILFLCTTLAASSTDRRR